MNSSELGEAIANADAHTNKVGLPTYSELLGALRSYDAAVWDDCRIPGDIREKLQAVHHNVLGSAERCLASGGGL